MNKLVSRDLSGTDLAPTRRTLYSDGRRTRVAGQMRLVLYQ